MTNLLIYSGFDTLALIFSLVLAMFIGNPFQPNPVALLIGFFSVRAALYYLWFSSIKKLKVPWSRLALHTSILLFGLIISVATVGLVIPGVSNNLFWFIIIPIVSFFLSLSLHQIYKLASLETK